MRAALEQVTAPARLTVLEGPAGTGKSHLLGVAREAREASGYEVRAAALAGRAAKGLQDGSGIRAQTSHALLSGQKDDRDRLDPRTVLVIDEAGMVGSKQFAEFLEAADRAHAKIVLVGDANQLRPIEAGELFERIGAEVGGASLTDIRRQRHEVDREMERALARGDTRAALESLQERGRVHTARDRDQAMQAMVDDWQRSREPGQPGADRMGRSNRDHAKRQGSRHDEWGLGDRDRAHRAQGSNRDRGETRRRPPATLAHSRAPAYRARLCVDRPQGARRER